MDLREDRTKRRLFRACIVVNIIILSLLWQSKAGFSAFRVVHKQNYY